MRTADSHATPNPYKSTANGPERGKPSHHRKGARTGHGADPHCPYPPRAKQESTCWAQARGPSSRRGGGRAGGGSGREREGWEPNGAEPPPAVVCPHFRDPGIASAVQRCRLEPKECVRLRITAQTTAAENYVSEKPGQQVAPRAPTTRSRACTLLSAGVSLHRVHIWQHFSDTNIRKTTSSIDQGQQHKAYVEFWCLQNGAAIPENRYLVEKGQTQGSGSCPCTSVSLRGHCTHGIPFAFALRHGSSPRPAAHAPADTARGHAPTPSRTTHSWRADYQWSAWQRVSAVQTVGSPLQTANSRCSLVSVRKLRHIPYRRMRMATGACQVGCGIGRTSATADGPRPCANAHLVGPPSACATAPYSYSHHSLALILALACTRARGLYRQLSILHRDASACLCGGSMFPTLRG